MQLSDFSIEKRGPRSFETWICKDQFHSSIGNFSLEVYADIGKQPTEEMLISAEMLVHRFVVDEADLIQKFYDYYISICSDAAWADWLKECDVASGLPLQQLPKYIRDRTLSVHDDLEQTVNITPNWDTEHGFNLHLIDNVWEQDK